MTVLSAQGWCGENAGDGDGIGVGGWRMVARRGRGLVWRSGAGAVVRGTVAKKPVARPLKATLA